MGGGGSEEEGGGGRVEGDTGGRGGNRDARKRSKSCKLQYSS